MIWLVAKHELRRSFRDGRSRSMLLVVVLMISASVALSLNSYKRTEKKYRENIEQSRYNWDHQAEKNPHDAAHDGTYLIKPSYPLSILDEGLQQYSGQVIHLGAHERKQSSLNEAKDHSGMFRFGTLAPNFVLLYVLPLLLIFLAYNAFTEERERQTIKLLLTQGIAPRQLALGKWLAVFIQMSMLFIVFFLLVAVGYSLLGVEQPVVLQEWLALGFAYMLYLVIFINLALLVSAVAKHSGASLTVLLGIWIVMTLIIPKFSTNMAASLHPFPTLQTFRNNINTDQANGLNGHNFWNEAAQDFQQKVLDEYGVESIEDLPVAYGGLLLAEGEKYESEIYTKHFDLLRSQYQKQRSVYRLSGSLSPFLPVRFVSMALARADYGFQWHYEDQAEKYRVELNTALNMNIAENSKGVDLYKADAKLWSSLPRFNYQWQEAGEVLSDHVIEYLIMLLWVGFSFIAMLSVSRKINAL